MYEEGNDAMAEHSRNATQEELWERIEEVRTAMMTTVELDGSLRGRPMWTRATSSTARCSSSPPTTDPR